MYSLIAEFPQQPVCRKRQHTGLLKWSAYILALPIPVEEPAEDWVKQRIVAGRIVVNPDFYVTQTINGTVSTPDIQTNIRQHMSPWNDETVEASMDLQVETAVGTIMPGYCAGSVSDAEARAWLDSNGFPVQQGNSPRRV